MYTKETCFEIISEYVTMRENKFGYCGALGNVIYNDEELWIERSYENGGIIWLDLKEEYSFDKITVGLEELDCKQLNHIIKNNYQKMLANFEKENLPDTTYEERKAQQPIKVEGLYAFDDEGNKITPCCVYFGIDFWQNGCVGGNAYYHYLNALRPVYLPDGTRYRVPHLRNVQARYKDGVLCEFERG